MLMNVEEERMTKEPLPPANKVIGLYKINYEMDIKGSSKDNNYIAGVIAYSSDEAVNTLIEFGRAGVKGFKGVRVHQVAFEGAIHTISKPIRKAILETAILEGKVVSKADYDALSAKESKKAKKSIIPKEEG